MEMPQKSGWEAVAAGLSPPTGRGVADSPGISTCKAVDKAGPVCYLLPRPAGTFATSQFYRPAHRLGAVAQMGERLVRNEEVRGSIPLGSTNFQPYSSTSR
jgi:hypothetical protein